MKTATRAVGQKGITMAIGGDLEQLLTLQNSLARNSQQIQELTGSITSELSNVHWEGPASDRFREAWHGEFSAALRRIEEALNDASTEVSRRREALAQAGN